MPTCKPIHVASGSTHPVPSTTSQLLPSTGRIPPPEELDKQGYPDLTNLVRLNEGSRFPAHTGGFSDVYIGHLIGDPTYKVAIKVLRTNNEQEEVKTLRRANTPPIQRLNREAAVWHRLEHSNVLKFLGLASDLGRHPECPALVAPYCDRGTLRDYLNLHPDMGTRVFMIKGVAHGLKYLHEAGVVHGDLKPSNVLISDEGNPLLCDFGRSKVLTLRGFTTRPAGACRYQAPELLDGSKNPDKPTDICAFGLSAFEIWTGVQPYNEIEHDTAVIVQVILHGIKPQRPVPPPPIKDHLWPILELCWCARENRLIIQDVVQRLESRN